MEDILELIEISRKKGQRSIQLVNQNFRKKEISKDNQLYEGIINGQFSTDEEAAQAMFGADPGNRNYRNAKGKLRQKLLNHLYFLDYDKESYTHYEKVRYDCLHQLHHVEILFHEGSYDIACKLLPTLIRTAQEYELVDMVIRGLILLRNEYARQGKTTQFIETSDELAEYREFEQVVESCETQYHQSLVYINKSMSAQQEVLEDIPFAIQRIMNQAKEYKSTYLEVLASRLSLIYNKLVWNFEDNITLCTELEEKFLQGHNHEVTVPLQKGEVAFEKMNSYLYLEEVKAGKAYAEKAWDLYKNGNEDWFVFGELYFLLLVKGEFYEEATEVYRNIRTNKNYGNLNPADHDRWQIYRAFLLFFNETKLLRWGFDVDEFISATPDYPREQMGYNIATLVVQFMFLFREGQLDQLRDKIEEISKYNSVHLDKRHNYRNSIFIRLMMIVMEKNFDYAAVYEKGHNYLKKLRKTKIPVDRMLDMEIVPYEKLWLHLLDILKSNKLYVHYRFYNANSQAG